MKKKYLDDFFVSLGNQSYKDFDLIIINDGYENIQDLVREYSCLNIIELKSSGTPSKNRECGINYVKDNKYDILIFGDSDDYFSPNRVFTSIEKLSLCDVVVNDFTLIDDEGVISPCYLSKRLKNNCKIDLEYIKDKNIFGMTNTSVNTSVLGDICFDENLVAVDWYLFSILLLEGNEAIFTNETVTYYRQYSGNTIGLSSLSDEMVLKSLNVKLKHYELMKKESNCFDDLYNEMLGLKNNIEKLSLQKNNNLFWWEEIKGTEK